MSDTESQEQNNKIRILLIDDSITFVEALRGFLERYDDLSVIGVAYNGEQAIDLIPKLQPDLILLDLSMPDITGLELLPKIRKLQPEVHIIIVTMFGYRQLLGRASVDDYVEKSRINTDLIPAIERLTYADPADGQTNDSRITPLNSSEGAARQGNINRASFEDFALVELMGESMKDKVILLVEDNLDDVNLTLRAFKKSHLTNEIVVARDGAQALDYLFGTGTYAGRDLAVLPQLILLDLKLPKVSGIEVLKRIRADERVSRLPIVALTSSSEPDDLKQCYDFGVNSYIRKPVNFVDFVEAVQQLEVYWLVLNSIPG